MTKAVTVEGYIGPDMIKLACLCRRGMDETDSATIPADEEKAPIEKGEVACEDSSATFRFYRL